MTFALGEGAREGPACVSQAYRRGLSPLLATNLHNPRRFVPLSQSKVDRFWFARFCLINKAPSRFDRDAIFAVRCNAHSTRYPFPSLLASVPFPTHKRNARYAHAKARNEKQRVIVNHIEHNELCRPFINVNYSSSHATKTREWWIFLHTGFLIRREK